MASRSRSRPLTRTRAASTVEYALILVAVVLLSAGSWKLLGGKLGTRSGSAGNVVAGEGNGSGGGGGKGAGGGGGGGGKASVSDKSSVASKVSVGGGGANGEQGGVTSNRDTSSEGAVASVSGGKDSGGNADVTESFAAKRWFGIGLLAAGVIAIGYVASSMRRTKKAADAAGGGKGSANAPRRRAKR